MGRPQSKGRRCRSDRARGPKIEGTDPTAISRKLGTNQQGIPNPETGRIKNGNDLPFHTLDIHLIAEIHPSPLATVRSTLTVRRSMSRLFEA
jgi:hypothetical protein